MASGERRMLFDTRGKRKHVIRVVYAVLALLMGASLFLVVGPLNIGELLGTQSSGSSAAAALDDQAERIEGRLAKSPEDEQLLLSLTRTRVAAGNAQIEVGPGETPAVSTDVRADFEAALRSWNRYLKQAGEEPSASAAALVARAFVTLAEYGSTSLEDAKSHIATAAAAQRIAVERQPTLGSLSSLAIDEYFNGNIAAGDKATKQAASRASSKQEAKSVEEQLAEYRKRGKQFTKRVEQEAKLRQKSGQEQLQNPFGGVGGAPSGSVGE